MPRTLIVTNDFPPRRGGIQSFVHALATRLPSGAVTVYAPAWEGAAEFDARQPIGVENGNPGWTGRLRHEVLHGNAEHAADDGQNQRDYLVPQAIESPELPGGDGQFQAEGAHERPPIRELVPSA